MLGQAKGSLLPHGLANGETLADCAGSLARVPDGLVIGSLLPHGLVDGERLGLIVVPLLLE
jgi:hypothetical protein